MLAHQRIERDGVKRDPLILGLTLPRLWGLREYQRKGHVDPLFERLWACHSDLLTT